MAGLVTSRMPGFGKGVPPSTRWGSQEMAMKGHELPFFSSIGSFQIFDSQVFNTV